MYDASPRIRKMLSQEQRDKIVKLESFHSISISWDDVAIFLKEKHPSFVYDSRVLNNMGFFLVFGTKNKFIKD